MIVVPDLGYAATDAGTRTLLQGLDRQTFELLLVPVFGGQETRSAPDDVRQFQLPAPGRAVRKRLQVERSLRESYPVETPWLLQIAGAIAELAAGEHADVILAQASSPPAPRCSRAARFLRAL